MFECRIENSKGEIITLTQRESDFQVINIEGLNPTNAQINFTNLVGLDGSKFNSSKLESKNLVIYIKLNNNVEANRIMLYNYFPTKESCIFYYKNEHRDVFIEGYVQTVEVSSFTNDEIMQVSLLCPQSYFKNIDEIVTDISNVLALFKFPFSINYNNAIPISNIEINISTNVFNDSESETGVIITVNVLDDINKIFIRNLTTGEYIGVNDTLGFVEGDLVTINTFRGEKSVTLLRNGVESKLFTKIISGSIFLQLSKGDNYFGYMIDDTADHGEYVEIKFKHRNIYRGV